MTKSFNMHTDGELLAIDNETLNDAIRLEAIERGIKPPMPLSEAIHKTEYRGYTRPPEAVQFWELMVEGYSGTGCGYLDKAKAEAALDGLMKFDENKYGSGGPKITTVTPTLQLRMIGVDPGESKKAKLEEYTQDNTEFDKVKDECLERLSKVRQDDYNKRVNAEKKAEYMRLAGGNEEIAKGFWAKVERTEWPL